MEINAHFCYQQEEFDNSNHFVLSFSSVSVHVEIAGILVASHQRMIAQPRLCRLDQSTTSPPPRKACRICSYLNPAHWRFYRAESATKEAFIPITNEEQPTTRQCKPRNVIVTRVKRTSQSQKQAAATLRQADLRAGISRIYDPYRLIYSAIVSQCYGTQTLSGFAQSRA